MNLKDWRSARRKQAGGLFRLPTQAHKNKARYSRKTKHKNRDQEG